MQSSELIGLELDYWTARAEGLDVEVRYRKTLYQAVEHQGITRFEIYAPSTNWAQAGPLIEKYNMLLMRENGDWKAKPKDGVMQAHGPTPQVAICRAVVRAEFSNKVPA